MRQRVMIAAAMACGPDLLIADEPTTALDVTVQAEILDLMADLKRETGAAMVLITHDMGVIARLADRVCVMKDGAYVEEGEAAEPVRQPADATTPSSLLDGDPAPRPRRPRRAAGAAAGAGRRAGGGRGRRREGVVPGQRGPVRAQAAAARRRRRQLRDPQGRDAGRGRRERLRQVHPVARGAEPAAGHRRRGDGAGPRHHPRRPGDACAPRARTCRSSSRTRWPASTRAPPSATRSPSRCGCSAPACRAPSAQAEAAAMMVQAGLSPDLVNRYPHELSGGQNQRVGIARAMILQPQLVICDEAVSALDVSIRAQIIDLLIELQTRDGPGDDVHQPRPGGGARDQPPGAGALPRPGDGAGEPRAALRRAAAPLHQGAAVRRADPRPGARAGPPARAPRRRAAQPARPARARCASCPRSSDRRAALRARSCSRSRPATWSASSTRCDPGRSAAESRDHTWRPALEQIPDEFASRLSGMTTLVWSAG